MERSISLKDYFSKYYKSVFLAYFLSAFFAHGYAISNLVGSNDAMGIIPGSAGAGTVLGRWFLDIIVSFCKFFFSDMFFLPWLDLLLGFFVIACSAFLIAYLFQVQSKVMVALITALMIVFPPVTAIALYGYTFHLDMISLFLAVCAAVLCLKEKVPSSLTAILLIALSLGIYQAYLPFSCAILVLYWIKKLAGKASCRSVIHSVLWCGVTVLGGLVLYFILTRFFCYYFHTPLGNYKGVDQMGSIFSLGRIGSSVAYSYMGIFRFLFKDTYGMTATNFAHAACAVYFTASFAVVVQLYKKMQKDMGRIALLSALLAVLPIAAHLIIFMVGGNKDVIYAPMLFGTVGIFLLLPLFYQEVSYFTKTIIVPFIMGSLVFIWIWTANTVYTASHQVARQNITVWNRIITQIESLEGYTSQTPVCLIGEYPVFPSVMDSYSEVEDLTGLRYVNGWSLPNFLKTYMGWEKTFVAPDSLPYSSALDEIPSYPDAGSIRLIDGVVVIRFSENAK